MSNAKWRRVLAALATANLKIARTEWKLIDSDRVESHPLPREINILDDRFADGPFQPFAYKWIEWTEYGDQANQTQCKAAGFDHHLVKPTDFDALKGLIEAHRSAARKQSATRAEMVQ